MKGACYEVIEGAGHLSNLEAPETFNKLVPAHLKRLKAGYALHLRTAMVDV